jgi:hypothetical protein
MWMVVCDEFGTWDAGVLATLSLLLGLPKHHAHIVFACTSYVCTVSDGRGAWDAGMLATLWMLLGLPQHHASNFIPLYVVCFIVNGLVNSWPAPACNNPIFAGGFPAVILDPFPTVQKRYPKKGKDEWGQE